MDYRLATTREKLSTWSNQLQRRVGVRNSLQEKLELLKTQEEELYDQATKATDALSFVESSVQSIRSKTFRSIESVANEALSVVYCGENLRVECDFDIKRDRSAVVIRITTEFPDGAKLKRNPDGSGCGVSDVIAICLRMVLIRATGCEPILVADEPFKWLGRDQIGKAAELLKYLSQKLDIQLIIASHHPELREIADRSYCLELNEERESIII